MLATQTDRGAGILAGILTKFEVITLTSSEKNTNGRNLEIKLEVNIQGSHVI